MRTSLDCIPCFVRQALKAAQLVSSDQEAQRSIVNEVMRRLMPICLEVTPPQIAQTVYRTVREISGNQDPYAALKRKHNEEILKLYPALQAMIQEADDPLSMAVQLAIAGNIIDLGVERAMSGITEEVLETMTSPLKIDHYDAFKDSIECARRILYLGDNAGEVVFDRLLLEEINLRRGNSVVFAVRGAPVINDITGEDATQTGVDAVAEIISNGADAPGTVLTECSPAFIKQYDAADIIISKGQGNFESLSEQKKNIFFLFKIKCAVVANHLSLRVDDAVLMQQGRV